jgi:threonine dehydratase
VYVSPYNDLQIVAGQGTAGLEVALEQVPALARAGFPGLAAGGCVAVVVPVGGGGLIAGVAAAVKGLGRRRGVEYVVVGSQPATNACVHRALVNAHGAASPSAGAAAFVDTFRTNAYENGPTLSDGTAGGVEADSLTLAAFCRPVRALHLSAADPQPTADAASTPRFAATSVEGFVAEAAAQGPWEERPLVDAVATVTEDEIRAALRTMLAGHRKVVEGAAGTVLAVSIKYGAMLRDQLGCTAVIAICCGSNISPEKVVALLN